MKNEPAEIIIMDGGVRKVTRNGKFVCYVTKLGGKFGWGAFKGQEYAIAKLRRDAIAKLRRDAIAAFE